MMVIVFIALMVLLVVFWVRSVSETLDLCVEAIVLVRCVGDLSHLPTKKLISRESI
jgi:hypothetical protein